MTSCSCQHLNIRNIKQASSCPCAKSPLAEGDSSIHSMSDIMDSEYSREPAAPSSVYVYTFLYFPFFKCQRISLHHPIDLNISFSFSRQCLSSVKGISCCMLYLEIISSENCGPSHFSTAGELFVCFFFFFSYRMSQPFWMGYMHECLICKRMPEGCCFIKKPVWPQFLEFFISMVKKKKLMGVYLEACL